MWLYLILLGIAYGAYKVYKNLQYWKERRVVHTKPIPFVGDFKDVVFKKKTFYDVVTDLYRAFPEERYIGFFQFTNPTLLIKDLELIKKVCVKDFDHFVNHRAIQDNIEPLLSKNLVGLRGDEWKEMRATLSPAFTSSKMKAMFDLIGECADQLNSHYLKKGNQIHEVEMKDLFTKYTNDVIATCAFGYKCNSIENEKNEFYKMGLEATDLSGLKPIKALLLHFAPTIIKALGISVIPNSVRTFFTQIIKETIEYRNKHGLIRPDMIHLLLQSRKGILKHEETAISDDKEFAVVEESSIGKQEIQMKNKEITDLDITAQAFIFFFAGFDTASTALSFMAYELTLNPDIQAKLFEEVLRVMDRTGGKPSYEDITNMKYLDMVVSETLRKWPPAPMTDRQCSKDYKIEPVNPEEKTYTIKEGDYIVIPILGVLRDEKFFPNPDKFDPERFSDENKKNIKAYTYLPFGIGPRACIGSRFALLEIKILFTHLLSKFKFVKVEKTLDPLVLSPNTIKIQPENGFWVGLKPRS